MRKSLAVVAAALMAGLTVTAAGCATSTRNLASLASNWYYDNGFKRIQPTFTDDGSGEFASEKLTYTVTKSEPSAGNSYYTVEYAAGTYTTEFYAKKVSASELNGITSDSWRSEYTGDGESNGGVVGSDGSLVLYYYATELTIPKVTYTLKATGEKKVSENESRKTVSYFLDVEDRLAPVYTKQTINSTAPANLQPASLDACFIELNREYESFYSLYGANVHTDITDTVTGEKIDGFDRSGLNGYTNSVFDAAYIDIVARAMQNMSSSLSQTVSIYTPGTPVQSYTFSGEDKALSTDNERAEKELNDLQNLLESRNLFKGGVVNNDDGTTSPKTLKTVAVNVAYNGGSFSGVSQSYWFAAADEANTARTLMVKYSAPIPYNLGSLDYVLTSIDSLPVLY